MEENKDMAAVENVQEEEVKKVEKSEEVVYTQAELDREISKRFEKWEQRQQQELKEATKLANMDAEEKARYEIDKAREELETMKLEFALQQNESQCMKILADRGVDVELAQFVVTEDAETMKENIDKLETIFKNAVEQEVNKRLPSSVPMRDEVGVKGLTTNDFNGMSMAERQQLYNTNKELYNALRG